MLKTLIQHCIHKKLEQRKSPKITHFSSIILLTASVLSCFGRVQIRHFFQDINFFYILSAEICNIELHFIIRRPRGYDKLGDNISPIWMITIISKFRKNWLPIKILIVNVHFTDQNVDEPDLSVFHLEPCNML